ncbi:MAG: T9SS type B sorting domain-containing protein, partial [Flavobacteriaceae bacterium]|nr:T9SS type B sorting domain-containing protein [Flavobacteriaceae bacterium]
NTTSPETIFVRIENNVNTDCFDTTTFNLVVNPAPVAAGTLPNLELCDVNNPGDEIELFDLTDVEAVLIGGQNFGDIDITYHETLADAQAGLNPIANTTAYANTANNQSIFVRLSNRVTGCENTTLSFNLIVNPLPQVNAGTVFEQCDDDTADGFTSFDLSTQNTLVTPMPQGSITITYHTTQADASNGANPLPQNFTNTASPQTIFARVENVQTGCVNTTDLTLVVIDAPNVTVPADIVFCDDNNPGDLTEVFDLTQTIVEIIGAQTGLTVTFHNSQADADNDVNAIANPASFQNSTTTQQIFVRIEHPTGCFNTTSFFIIVNPIPMPFLPETHLLCLDDTGNIVETASSPPVLDSGLTSAGLVFEWDLNGTILVGENNPTLTALDLGIYTVTVTDANTGCQNSATTEVIPLGPPDDFGAEVVTPFFAERHRIEAFATGLAEQYIFRLDDGPWQYNGRFDNVSPGPHTVSIRDKEGCAEVIIPLDVIGYPRYFTPNADGFHDTWNIVGLNGESTTKIYIFDRFGKLLKQINPAGEGWDGTFNGNPLPSSDYWFKVEYVEEGVLKTFGGHFTLKR